MLMTNDKNIGKRQTGTVYFLSDAHLGSLANDAPRKQEKLLVDFLEGIRGDAKAVYLLGDMFDFWHEYKHVVPKGFTRFLGKLAELSDDGVDIHYFTGNHDIWEYGYLHEECGVTVHHEPAIVTIDGKRFYLAHGDGLGDNDPKFRMLKGFFTSKVCQWLFRNVMPTSIGMPFGRAWAKHSRMKRTPFIGQPGYNSSGEPVFMGEDKEFLVLFAKDYLKTKDADIDYFIFGHRHIELDLMLTRSARLMILGDWITQYTYATFSNGELSMDCVEEAPQCNKD